MPRFEHNPANVAASIEVFPKDDYEFIVGEPKPFHGITKSGKNEGKENYGMRFALSIGRGDYQGKRTVYTIFEHNEGSQSVGKQFKMAVLGFGKGRAEEQRFDAEFGGKDWSFDTDSGEVGDAWREMTGQRVTGSLDVEQGQNGDEQQSWKGWRVAGR